MGSQPRETVPDRFNYILELSLKQRKITERLTQGRDWGKVEVGL
jgi:hypothetical protein